MTLRHPSRLAIFGTFALLANVLIALLLRHDHRSIVTAASCVDFLVSLPALYYFLVIRAGAQPLITIVPVLAAGLMRAAYVAPVGGIARMAIAGVCEVGIAWFVFRRGRDGFVARMLLSELSLLRSDISAEGRLFTMHKAGGVCTLFRLFAGVAVLEAFLTHAVLQRWSVTAARVIFALSVYGAFLLLALARSFSVRPIVVKPHSILIRSGALWSVEIAPENIARVETSNTSIADGLRITAMSEPNVFIELFESVSAQGLYGRRKMVSSIAISADQPSELIQAIRSLIAAD
jgi:hypothetical protein